MVSPRPLFDGRRLVELVDGAAVPIVSEAAQLRAALALLGDLHADTLRGGTAVAERLVVPPDPPEFLNAVEEAISPAAGTRLLDRLRETYVSIDRFLKWGRVLDAEVGLRGARVLVSGCGPAGSMKAYSVLGARWTMGSEVDPKLAALATIRLRDHPTALPFLYDGSRLPLPDGCVDLVESIDVIEHVPDADAYVAEHGRVLARGGSLLVVTPNRLYPVEQHLDLLGPPWLPVRAANALFSGLARVERLGDEGRFRYGSLATVRTQNMSFRRLRALAKRHGLFLQQLDPHAHADRWPLPRSVAPLERFSGTRAGKFAAPVRTLAVLLRKR